MDSDENTVVTRVLTELKNYAPIVLPTLFVFALESKFSLKYWHAVQQLPTLEPEQLANADDAESNIDKAEVAKTRKAITKEARRSVLGYLGIALTLISIASFEQFVAIKGFISRHTRDGDDFDPSVYDEPGVENDSADWYSWYYNSSFGQLDWSEYYYSVVLFLPATFLIARSLSLFLGQKDRIVLRNGKNLPFMVTSTSMHLKPLHAFIMQSATIIFSMGIAIRALWIREIIYITVLYMSLVHFQVSYGSMPEVTSLKLHLMTAVFMPLMQLGVYRSNKPGDTTISFLFFTPPSSNTDWSALIFSALIGGLSYNFIALCYRLDHNLAHPDVRIAGPPDTEVMLSDASPVHGTRLWYAHLHSVDPSTIIPSPRFAKPYFHAAVWGWLMGYAFMATLGASGLGYLACTAESAGLYGLCVLPPFMASAVMFRALLRGEVRKLLAYKEEWGVEAPAVALKEMSLEEKEKMHVSESEINEKDVLEA